MGFAWLHSVSDANFCVAEQLRIRLCDGEPELLLNVLFGGGCRVRVTIKFRFLALLPFDAHHRDDT